MVNFDDINSIKLELKKEEVKLLKIKLKVKQLQLVIESHEQGIYNPVLYEELMRRIKEVKG